MFPASPPGRPGQIEQQSEVLAPEQFGRREAAVEGDFDRSQRSAGDHREHRAAARVAASRARGAIPGSGLDHNSSTRAR